MACLEWEDPSADMLRFRSKCKPHTLSRDRGFGVRPGTGRQAFDPDRFQRVRVHEQLPNVSRASIGALEINSLAVRGPGEREVYGPLSHNSSNRHIFELLLNCRSNL